MEDLLCVLNAASYLTTHPFQTALLEGILDLLSQIKALGFREGESYDKAYTSRKSSTEDIAQVCLFLKLGYITAFQGC